MKKGGIGGSKTAQAGADFEKSTLETFLAELQENGFTHRQDRFAGSKGVLSGISLKSKTGKSLDLYFKNGVHKLFFEPRGIRSADFFSARLEPDTAIFSEATNTLTIIEKKQQETQGSVAEKLQTCDFKMFYYKTLCERISVEVDLVWQLGPKFKEDEGKLQSVFAYMNSKGSRYFFFHIPVNELRI